MLLLFSGALKSMVGSSKLYFRVPRIDRQQPSSCLFICPGSLFVSFHFLRILAFKGLSILKAAFALNVICH